MIVQSGKIAWQLGQRRALSTTSALGNNQKLDVMSFINRIDALYEGQSKKAPIRRNRDLTLKKRPAKPAASTADKSGATNASSKGPGQGNWKNKVEAFKQRGRVGTNRSGAGAGGASNRSDRPVSSSSAAASEKLELHIDTTSAAPKRVGTLSKFREARGDKKVVAERMFGFNKNKRTVGGSGPGGKRPIAGAGKKGGRFTKSKDYTRSDRKGMAKAAAPAEQHAKITSQTAVEAIQNILDQQSKTNGGFVQIADPSSRQNIIANLPTSAITYETKVWSAIQKIKNEAESSTSVAALIKDKEEMSRIVKENVFGQVEGYVHGDGLKFVLGSGNKNQPINIQALINGVNTNPTLSPAARMLIANVGAGQTQMKQLQ